MKASTLTYIETTLKRIFGIDEGKRRTEALAILSLCNPCPFKQVSPLPCIKIGCPCSRCNDYHKCWNDKDVPLPTLAAL